MVSETQLKANAAHSDIASTVFEAEEHYPHANTLWFLRFLKVQHDSLQASSSALTRIHSFQLYTSAAYFSVLAYLASNVLG